MNVVGNESEGQSETRILVVRSNSKFDDFLVVVREVRSTFR
jgi:hypothetical protein